MTDMEDSHNKGRQAGANVEITPEMIEAGLAAWSEYDERFESSDEMIERVYRAMSIKAKANESVSLAEGR